VLGACEVPLVSSVVDIIILVRGVEVVSELDPLKILDELLPSLAA
jgi:hypothetical protein